MGPDLGKQILRRNVFSEKVKSTAVVVSLLLCVCVKLLFLEHRGSVGCVASARRSSRQQFIERS